MSEARTSRAVVKGLPRWIMGTAALVGFATLSFFTDRSETTVYPSIGNFRASGTAVFAELLRAQGINVVIDTASQPRLGPNDLVIFPSRVDVFDLFDEFDDELSGPWSNQSSREVKRARATVARFVNNGGTVIAPLLRREFAADVSASGTQKVWGPGKSSAWKINSPMPQDADAYALTAWKIGPETPFVTVTPVKSGRVVRIENAAFLTNRLIDRDENADLAVEVVRRVLPRSGRVVFVEADLNNVRDQSLWQAIGPYASAAYLQAMLFAGVVVWALGRRFGPPLRLGVHARASRELVDAFGNLLSRARRTELACVYLYEHLDHRARRALKLSPLASDKDRDARMPETAVRLLHELKAAGVSGTTLSSRELTRLAKTSLTAIGDLERSARAR